MMTRPSWLTIAIAASAGFLCGVLLVAVLGGAKGPSRTVTHTVARTVSRTVTAPVDSGGAPGAGAADGLPDVVGLPLDEARDALESAGYDIDVSHDGLFPIIDESNWTVDDERPAPGALVDPSATIHLHVSRG